MTVDSIKLKIEEYNKFRKKVDVVEHHNECISFIEKLYTDNTISKELFEYLQSASQLNYWIISYGEKIKGGDWKKARKVGKKILKLPLLPQQIKEKVDTTQAVISKQISVAVKKEQMTAQLMPNSIGKDSAVVEDEPKKIEMEGESSVGGFVETDKILGFLGRFGCIASIALAVYYIAPIFLSYLMDTVVDERAHQEQDFYNIAPCVDFPQIGTNLSYFMPQSLQNFGKRTIEIFQKETIADYPTRWTEGFYNDSFSVNFTQMRTNLSCCMSQSLQNFRKRIIEIFQKKTIADDLSRWSEGFYNNLFFVDFTQIGTNLSYCMPQKEIKADDSTRGAEGFYMGTNLSSYVQQGFQNFGKQIIEIFQTITENISQLTNPILISVGVGIITTAIFLINKRLNNLRNDPETVLAAVQKKRHKKRNKAN